MFLIFLLLLLLLSLPLYFTLFFFLFFVQFSFLIFNYAQVVQNNDCVSVFFLLKMPRNSLKNNNLFNYCCC